MQPVDLITLSREYGAGASALAEKLGAHLGWRVLDTYIPHLVAERIGLDEAAIEEADEHVPSMLENIGNALLIGSPDVLIDPEVAQLPDPERVAIATRAVMVEAAERPPLIVVGHGGQSLFHDRPRTLHLRLVAPIKDRVRRICERRVCNPAAAIDLAHRLDADRARYIRQHYSRDVRDPMLYHLQINTGLVSLDEAMRLVIDLMQPAASAARA